MRSGRLRHRVTVQRNTPTRGDAGGRVDNWADLATVWASIWPLAGKEAVQGRAENAEVTHRVQLRWQSSLADLSPRDRLIFAGRVLEIVGVVNVGERNRELELLCRETER